MRQLTIAFCIIVILAILYIRQSNQLKCQVDALDATIAQQKTDLATAQAELTAQNAVVDKCRGDAKTLAGKDHEHEVEITALKALMGDRYDQLEKISSTVDTYRRTVHDLKAALRKGEKDKSTIDMLTWNVGALTNKLQESQQLISSLSEGMSWQRWRIWRLQQSINEMTGPPPPETQTYVCGNKFDCHYYS